MISQQIQQKLAGSSLIRNMFEEGNALKQRFGADNVFDFSLGNPEPEPPVQLVETLQQLVLENAKGSHGYMSNGGYAWVREKLAAHVSQKCQASLDARHISMSCGAGGGLNVVLKTLLDEGDEVIVFAPYFGEYRHYVDNHHGVLVEVPCNRETFLPDLDRLELALSASTKAIIINSPNNPTGVAYDGQFLRQMAEIIARGQRRFGTAIYLVSDEPYSSIVYDGFALPQVFDHFTNCVLVGSFSKSHSIPGERIGYIAVHPEAEDAQNLCDGLVLSNRILGFVNAPALFQQVAAECLEHAIDPQVYQQRRDLLFDHLVSLGFQCVKPNGAFYLFPKTPMDDDMEFKNLALKHNIIVVPGAGFGMAGYFRLSYCIGLESIRRSLEAFSALAQEIM